jgi:hypothetical protein
MVLDAFLHPSLALSCGSAGCAGMLDGFGNPFVTALSSSSSSFIF